MCVPIWIDSGSHALRGNPLAGRSASPVAIELACRLTDWTNRAIGAYYGGISGVAVSVARHRIRECPAAQGDSVEQLIAELTKETTVRH